MFTECQEAGNVEDIGDIVKIWDKHVTWVQGGDRG